MPEKLTTRRVASLTAAMRPVEVRDVTPGLVLRVREKSWAWSIRRTVVKRDYRLDLGDAWSLDEAREIATEVDRRIRISRDPWHMAPEAWEEWYGPRYRRKHGIPEPERPAVAPLEAYASMGQPHLRWPKAIELWREEVARTKKSRTVPSYVKALRVEEMRRFENWDVQAITRQVAAEAVADIARRGKERQAETTASAVRGLFEFLGRFENQRLSGVEEGRMDRLRAPPRSIAKDEDFDDEGKRNVGFIPDGAMVGLIVRGLRDDASPILERDRLAAMLMAYTVQRRLTVASARKREFTAIGEGRGVWTIPPLHRKAGSAEIRKGHGARPHLVPLPASVWAVVRRAMRMYPDSEWLFPAVRKWRADVPVTHVNETAVTKALSRLAGNPVSPHSMRRALSTTYKREARLTPSQTKLILDHNEGFDSNDVTRRHYDFDELLAEKWPVMEGYVAWVDACAKLRD